MQAGDSRLEGFFWRAAQVPGIDHRRSPTSQLDCRLSRITVTESYVGYLLAAQSQRKPLL